jgi:hypothetical protein
MAIDVYSISDYFISGYFISGYFIGGYFLLMVIGGYYRVINYC